MRIHKVELKPDDQRRGMRRIYHSPEVKLRGIFSIPDDEMILEFVWDKNRGELVLTTLKDYDEKGDGQVKQPILEYVLIFILGLLLGTLVMLILCCGRWW
jgi:hypothetical protein